LLRAGHHIQTPKKPPLARHQIQTLIQRFVTSAEAPSQNAKEALARSAPNPNANTEITSVEAPSQNAKEAPARSAPNPNADTEIGYLC
ncbi:hypothetical protein KJE20_14423, partial [Pyrenophora tritici-repentis]